ncbi:MAG: phytanoyl-CoA dioxygenase family protein [Planctomycetota bacterium]|jgi:ectoine hydroxylase-related dioxygenase (phytanoyl-CoA dioxygenase family)|nr:phytanoyl-CoA dioxygenase family protein [Planctomycetota bacterium]
MVTTEQIQFFDENGYLAYGKVIEPEDVEELRAGLDRMIELELNGGDDSLPEFKFGHRRDKNQESRAITQFVNMFKREPAYRRLLHNPEICETAAALLHALSVRLWHDQIISKPPEANGHFRFHQDFFFWPLAEPQIVSCWLALDDATVENGCMHVISASHNNPDFSPEARSAESARQAEASETGEEFETYWDRMAKELASIGKPIELKAGECMFHHCLNFHATPQNTTDRQRRAHVMILMAEGMRVNLAQSPGHVLVPNFEVEDGEPLVGKGHPVCDPDKWSGSVLGEPVVS